MSQLRSTRFRFCDQHLSAWLFVESRGLCFVCGASTRRAEVKWTSCSYSTNTGNATHAQDAGITCFNGNPVRLGGTISSSFGTLQVYHEGVWGTVCENVVEFSNEAASVVCRQLGYTGGSTLSELNQGLFGRVWLADVSCAGNGGCPSLSPTLLLYSLPPAYLSLARACMFSADVC